MTKLKYYLNFTAKDSKNYQYPPWNPKGEVPASFSNLFPGLCTKHTSVPGWGKQHFAVSAWSSDSLIHKFRWKRVRESYLLTANFPLLSIASSHTMNTCGVAYSRISLGTYTMLDINRNLSKLKELEVHDRVDFTQAFDNAFEAIPSKIDHSKKKALKSVVKPTDYIENKAEYVLIEDYNDELAKVSSIWDIDAEENKQLLSDCDDYPA